jgi:hypothetical protein
VVSGKLVSIYDLLLVLSALVFSEYYQVQLTEDGTKIAGEIISPSLKEILNRFSTVLLASADSLCRCHLLDLTTDDHPIPEQQLPVILAFVRLLLQANANPESF